jgi:hypothetical protein
MWSRAFLKNQTAKSLGLEKFRSHIQHLPWCPWMTPWSVFQHFPFLGLWSTSVSPIKVYNWKAWKLSQLQVLSPQSLDSLTLKKSFAHGWISSAVTEYHNLSPSENQMTSLRISYQSSRNSCPKQTWPLSCLLLFGTCSKKVKMSVCTGSHMPAPQFSFWSVAALMHLLILSYPYTPNNKHN